MENEQVFLGGNSEKKTNLENVTPDNKQKEQTYNIPSKFLDDEFKVPTETIDLPSKGVFYPDNKSFVEIKYLTAEEDDILYSSDLIKSGKVLDVLLEKSVLDKNLRPDDMISGDRNYLLIEMRKTGLGSEYVPGEIKCPSCGHVHSPVVDLDKLSAKELEVMPDSEVNGIPTYSVLLPTIKKNIKFRLLTGKDEKRLSKLSEVKSGAAGVKVSKMVTEKYVMQIMEVDGNVDKLYIKRFIGIMPMKDSAFFREYVKRIEPGLDLSYEFECPNCGHLDDRDVPITPRLYYPDLEM